MSMSHHILSTSFFSLDVLHTRTRSWTTAAGSPLRCVVSAPASSHRILTDKIVKTNLCTLGPTMAHSDEAAVAGDLSGLRRCAVLIVGEERAQQKGSMYAVSRSAQTQK